jgi:hypothetical protein
MSADTDRMEKAEKLLKLLMGTLIFWDFGLGVYAVFFAKNFETWIRFTPQYEPLFIRGVGMYWLFAAWFQFLGSRNPRKYLVAVQLAIFFRTSAIFIDSAEIYLLQRPWYFFHSMLAFFILMNFLIAVSEATLLKRMGLKWIDWSK